MSISYPFLLDCKFYAEKFTDSLMDVPLFARTFFSLLAFQIPSLSMVLDSFSIVYLKEDLFWMDLFWYLCPSLTWRSKYFP